MDIFDGKLDKLIEYKLAPLLFTSLEHSTSSVKGNLSNLDFEEEDVIDMFECTNNIISIDCNYGHIRSKTYVFKLPPKKSDRGRKKKVKVLKPRKYQGDGSCFNSQITFRVIGTHVRHRSSIPKTTSRDVTIVTMMHGLESVEKSYKIKVFRNGSITVPGILAEDLSDLTIPLGEVCAYLTDMFILPITVVSLYSVMKNYIFRLTNKQIDLRALQAHCAKHFGGLLNTRFSDISSYLVNPAFEDGDKTPIFDGWNAALVADPEKRLSYVELHRYLIDSCSSKNLHVDFDKLIVKIKSMPFEELYDSMQQLYKLLHANYISLHNDTYKIICKHLLSKYLLDINKYLTKSKDNMLSHIKYDPENYPGFLIKIKTPNEFKSTKKTTVKLFDSGKINIDGANSREEADFIYWWLNNLFYTNPQLIRRDDAAYDDSDSEFSSDSESG
jgi:hypothetical protein